MPAFRINDLELDALHGAGADIFQLYVGALRPRMDFKTGVVGRRVRISYQALKEWTERNARHGVKYLAHDKSKLQRMLTRLQEMGLLRRMGGPYEMVFACPLADKDKNVQKQPDTTSIQSTAPVKASRGKGSQRTRAPVDNAKAATHQESGKTLKPTPPTPSCLRHEEDGKAINPPTPAAQEADNPLKDDETTKAINPPAPAAQEEGSPLKGDETPTATQGRNGPSEQRHEPLNGGGDRPPARLAGEKGSEPVLTWEPHLDWPTGITQRQRAYIACSTAPLSKTLAQRVLDEWHGATKAGVVGKPWPYFNSLLRNAKECGEAWETHYAEDVEAAREQERIRLVNQAAADAAFAAQIDGEPGPLPRGELGKLVRRGGRK